MEIQQYNKSQIQVVKIIEMLLDKLGILFEQSEVFKRLNVQNNTEFIKNKVPKMLEFMKENNIHWTHLENAISRLYELTRPPTIADIVRLSEPQANYEMEFNRTSIERNKILMGLEGDYSIFHYNIALILDKQGTSILSTKYDDCKQAFISAYKVVDCMVRDNNELEPVYIPREIQKEVRKDVSNQLKRLFEAIEGQTNSFCVDNIQEKMKHATHSFFEEVKQNNVLAKCWNIFFSKMETKYTAWQIKNVYGYLFAKIDNNRFIIYVSNQGRRNVLSSSINHYNLRSDINEKIANLGLSLDIRVFAS